jgi:hypothetical protein
MNKKISDSLTLVVTRFFQQNVFFRNQLEIHGNINVLIDSNTFTCSINEKFRKPSSEVNPDSTQFATQHPLHSHVRNPRTISESTNLTFDADDAVVDAAVSMIDDFDEAMLSLGDGLSESRGLRAGLGASNSSLPSVDRFSTTSEKNQPTARTSINMDSFVPFEKTWCSENMKSVQNERNMSAKDLESLLASERFSLTPKPHMALVPINTSENQRPSPLGMLVSHSDISKSVVSKDRTLAQNCSSSALLPVQSSISHSWNQIIQYLQSQHLDASTLAGWMENINMMFNKPLPSPAPPVVNTPAPNFSESFLQELSNLLNASQTSVEISDLYNPDFNCFIDDMPNPPVPPNSPTRPESRLGPLLSSNEFFSSLETFQMSNSEQNSRPDPSCENDFDSGVPIPGARKRTESEVSIWQPQEIQTLDTGHDELDQLSLSGKIDNDHDTVEQKPLSLQESIAEMLSGKVGMSGLQTDVWFGQGKRVVERSEHITQPQEQTRHRHMSENLQVSRHAESLRHRHMSENVCNLFSQTHDDPTFQQNATESVGIFSQVQEEHVRHRHASENVALFSHEHAAHTTRMRHRSEHTLGFTQVNDEPSRIRHSSGNVPTFSQMSDGQNRARHSSGNTDVFSPLDGSMNRIRHASGNTDVFSPMTTNTSMDRQRHTSGNTQDFQQLDGDVTRIHHNSGETQVMPQLDLNVSGISQDTQEYGVPQVNQDIKQMNLKQMNLKQMNLNQTNHDSGSADIFQQINAGIAGINQGVQDAGMFQHHDLTTDRMRHLSGDDVYTQVNDGVRSRHVSGNVQEFAQFGPADLGNQESENTLAQLTGLVQDQVRIRHISGDIQTFQQLQGLENDQPVGVADGQFMPQADAEVRNILQGNVAQSFSQQIKVEQNQRLQGAESAPIYSPANVIKIRHASVTFSPVVSVLQRDRHASGTPQLISPAQQDVNEMRPASETAALMSQQIQDETMNRIRHASETAVLMSQVHNEATRIRHISETLQKTNKMPQPTDVLVFPEIFDSAKEMKLTNDQVSSKSAVVIDKNFPRKNMNQVHNLSVNQQILSAAPEEEIGQLSVVQNDKVEEFDCQNGQEEDEDDIPLSQYRFTCPVCGDKLRDLSTLSAHKVHVHNNLRCGICNKKCRDLHKLAQHIRRHTNTPQWTCEVCGKGFIYANSYKVGIKQYQKI